MAHRPLALILSLPLLLILAGTAGYILIEGWPLLDALYMTVITLTTVGYREVHQLSTAGIVFTMVFVLVGVFTIFYAGIEVIRSAVEGGVHQIFGRQRMERSLSGLKDHFIVCGLGRMGRLVCAEFSSLGLAFVVIERRGELLRGFDYRHGIPLEGDATSDEVLRQAGVERARCLVTVAASDADNLYITMSARLLNDKLFIVARAEGEGSDKKLLRAGANRVVSPYVIGGQRVAQAVLRPAVVDFIELATRSQHLELQIEEVGVRTASPLAGQDLRSSHIRRELGIIIVAIKKPDGRMVFNPAPTEVIDAGDTLIVLGHRQQLDRLAEQARLARPEPTTVPADAKPPAEA